MNYTLASATLIRAECGQVEHHRDASKGKTKLTTSAEISVDERAGKTIRVIVTVRLAGLPENSEGEEQEAFWAECGYRHLATVDGKISESDITPSLANSLAAPLYFTALNHCQQLVWNMGFSGVRPPLKDPPHFSEDDMRGAAQKKARRKRAAKTPEQGV